MRTLFIRLCSVAMLVACLLSVAQAGDQVTGKRLRIGTMPNALGLPIELAIQRGYFKDAGVDVELIVFVTGAPINEAMGADELDIAVSGMASVYALATGRYVYIADGVIAVEGETIYARPDSPVVKVKGALPGLLGDAKTLKGVSILGPLATAGHYSAIKYIEAAGLTAADFKMVAMDYPQAYQAFAVGQGDLVASTMPYAAKLEEGGFVKVSDLKDLGVSWMDTVFAQREVVEKYRGDVKAFLGLTTRLARNCTTTRRFTAALA